MSTPKTTGSGCTDCSNCVSELQDQVEALSRELAESKEHQNGMGKEIDALKELFEGMRSAVFTAPSTGPVKPVVSSPQGTSGNIPAPDTPPVASTLPASLPTPLFGDIPAPTAEHFSRPISPPQAPPPSQQTVDIEASTETAALAEFEAPAELEAPAEMDAPAELEAPAEMDVPAELEAPAEMDAPAELEVPTEFEAPVDNAAPGQMQVDSKHLIYTFIFFILIDCIVAGHGGSPNTARADLPMGVSTLPSIIISPAEIDSVAAALGLTGFPVEPTPPTDDSTMAGEVPVSDVTPPLEQNKIVNPVPVDTDGTERVEMGICGSEPMDTT